MLLSILVLLGAWQFVEWCVSCGGFISRVIRTVIITESIIHSVIKNVVFSNQYQETCPVKEYHTSDIFHQSVS